MCEKIVEVLIGDGGKTEGLKKRKCLKPNTIPRIVSLPAQRLVFLAN